MTRNIDFTPDNPTYRMDWSNDAPTITVRRANKYGAIRDAVEQIAAGTSKLPFLTITAKNSHDASNIAQSISQYRNERELTGVIAYAKRGEKVHVWNEKTTSELS